VTKFEAKTQKGFDGEFSHDRRGYEEERVC
jgi:hypothetical protein